MKSMLESYLTLEQTALLAATLAAQTRASGSLEAPLVARTVAEPRAGGRAARAWSRPVRVAWSLAVERGRPRRCASASPARARW
jgi:hypothetical protein